jgi:hypothetical protein
VATRWHYLIDIPVGLGLGWLAVWLAEMLLPEPEKAKVVDSMAPPRPEDAPDAKDGEAQPID